MLCTMYMFYIWSGHNLLIVIIGPRMQIRNTQQTLLERRVLKGLKPLGLDLLRLQSVSQCQSVHDCNVSCVNESFFLSVTIVIWNNLSNFYQLCVCSFNCSSCIVLSLLSIFLLNLHARFAVN